MNKKLLVKLIGATCGTLGLVAVLISIPEFYEKNPIAIPRDNGTGSITEELINQGKPMEFITDGYVNDLKQESGETRGNDTAEDQAAETPMKKEEDTYLPPSTSLDGEITIIPEPTANITPTPTPIPIPTPIPTHTPEPIETLISEEGEDMVIKVYMTAEKEYAEVLLEEYITGVVIAEMSYLSETEALRAQAVAARTYCLNRMNNPPKEHPKSSVCNKASHCMGYYSKEYIVNKYGETKGNEIWKMINDIVISTKGEYLTYDGKLISAMFHDSSYGCTESAENLYGYAKEYLVCVRTPEEKTEYIQTFTVARVIKSLFENTSELSDLTTAVGEIKRFEDSGRCESIEIYGKKFKALQVFIALGVRSMDFDVTYNGNEFVFVSRGFGHGIGMSQKGAKIYAQMGLDYREILFHYYKGCEIENLRNKKM